MASAEFRTVYVLMSATEFMSNVSDSVHVHVHVSGITHRMGVIAELWFHSFEGKDHACGDAGV
jgi:hypothetical protein